MQKGRTQSRTSAKVPLDLLGIHRKQTIPVPNRLRGHHIFSKIFSTSSSQMQI